MEESINTSHFLNEGSEVPIEKNRAALTPTDNTKPIANPPLQFKDKNTLNPDIKDPALDKSENMISYDAKKAMHDLADTTEIPDIKPYVEEDKAAAPETLKELKEPTVVQKKEEVSLPDKVKPEEISQEGSKDTSPLPSTIKTAVETENKTLPFEDRTQKGPLKAEIKEEKTVKEPLNTELKTDFVPPLQNNSKTTAKAKTEEIIPSEFQENSLAASTEKKEEETLPPKINDDSSTPTPSIFGSKQETELSEARLTEKINLAKTSAAEFTQDEVLKSLRNFNFTNIKDSEENEAPKDTLFEKKPEAAEEDITNPVIMESIPKNSFEYVQEKGIELKTIRAADDGAEEEKKLKKEEDEQKTEPQKTEQMIEIPEKESLNLTEKILPEPIKKNIENRHTINEPEETEQTDELGPETITFEEKENLTANISPQVVETKEPIQKDVSENKNTLADENTSLVTVDSEKPETINEPSGTAVEDKTNNSLDLLDNLLVDNSVPKKEKSSLQPAAEAATPAEIPFVPSKLPSPQEKNIVTSSEKKPLSIEPTAASTQTNPQATSSLPALKESKEETTIKTISQTTPASTNPSRIPTTSRSLDLNGRSLNSIHDLVKRAYGSKTIETLTPSGKRLNLLS